MNPERMRVRGGRFARLTVRSLHRQPPQMSRPVVEHIQHGLQSLLVIASVTFCGTAHRESRPPGDHHMSEDDERFIIDGGFAPATGEMTFLNPVAGILHPATTQELVEVQFHGGQQT